MLVHGTATYASSGIKKAVRTPSLQMTWRSHASSCICESDYNANLIIYPNGRRDGCLKPIKSVGMELHPTWPEREFGSFAMTD
jgi:hypothetical protein